VANGPANDRGTVANPIKALQGLGQSVWLDYLRRSLFTSGEFSRLIMEDGLRGVTSNPSIFEKAIAGSTDYLDALQDIERRGDLEPMALYEVLAIRDIREAADLLRPVYDATGRVDGYVSLEVSPYLAHDTAGTIEDARRLWKAVGRDNLMIKVPGTAEGVPAIRQLISEGVNVNITLLFGIGRYADVAIAYIEGLSTFVEHGGDAPKMGSVASFFVSRIDTMVDAMIVKRLATVTDANTRARLLPDDRRREGHRAAPRSSVCDAGAGPRFGSAHTRPQPEVGRDRGTRLSALRAERRRSLREDGSQRDRIRDHGGVCRRPEHLASRQRRHAGDGV
jgi:transaldolase/glucose-6-phosphate isomerase